ncbi:MAG: OmpH family outer membrane protein, partial [Bacteroidetes bacterium]|nr:OmpH family outer membrane protein [Bacteroidota bacterium]
MKNLSLILNGVLLVAVGVLYFLFFSNKKGNASAITAPSNLKIAYIKTDTILKYYDFFKEMKIIYEAKNKRL